MPLPRSSRYRAWHVFLPERKAFLLYGELDRILYTLKTERVLKN